MTIICGTDFSSASDAACAVAAELARKEAGKLVLAHAVPSADELPAARARLEQRAAELGVEATVHVVTGSADAALIAAASAQGAAMIVLAATSRTETRPFLGHTADRIAASVAVPVLVVRDGFPVHEWIAGSRPLRITVATDLSPISDHAVAWVSQLRSFGPCELTVAHLSWQPDSFQHLEVESPLSLDHGHPIVGEAIRRALEAAATTLREAGSTEVVVESPAGESPAETLNRIAQNQRADLLVVGHRPVRAWRIWEGSVARMLMRSAAMSVACIPDVDLPGVETIPKIAHVIAATDLSQAGNAAVLYALSLVEQGGAVTVLHVLDDVDADSEARTRIADELSALGRAQRADVQVRVEVIEHEHRAAAICDAAEERDADLICISSAGRSRLPRIFLSSVAQEVLLLSRKPVVVVPA